MAQPSPAVNTFPEETFWRDRLSRAGVPTGLHDGLVNYICYRLPPGSFLRAVLENDLRGAIGRADEVCALHLRELVQFLYQDCPARAWGSPHSVDEWLSRLEEAPRGD